MKSRVRTVLGPVNHPCGLCGEGDALLVESRDERRLGHRLSPSWDPRIRLTAKCLRCGARTRVDTALAKPGV